MAAALLFNAWGIWVCAIQVGGAVWNEIVQHHVCAMFVCMCIMYASCMYHVCIMYVSCMYHVYITYISCMYHVCMCIMDVFTYVYHVFMYVYYVCIMFVCMRIMYVSCLYVCVSCMHPMCMNIRDVSTPFCRDIILPRHHSAMS